MLNLLFYVVKSFVLRFFDSKYQIYLNGGSALLYVLLGGALCSGYGLMGFCIGALITNISKLVAVLVIYKKAG